MLKSVLVSLSFLISVGAFAAAENSTRSYELQMELRIDGKKVAEPVLVAIEGTKASILQRTPDSKDGTFIEVVASEETKEDHIGALRMNFVVGTIDRNGKRTVIAQPGIISNEASKAEVSTHDDDGDENFSLSVVYRRRGANVKTAL